MTTAELRGEVAVACRVLATEGLVENILGHVSARVGGRMLIRCRGPRERGLRPTRTARRSPSARW